MIQWKQKKLIYSSNFTYIEIYKPVLNQDWVDLYFLSYVKKEESVY